MRRLDNCAPLGIKVWLDVVTGLSALTTSHFKKCMTDIWLVDGSLGRGAGDRCVD